MGATSHSGPDRDTRNTRVPPPAPPPRSLALSLPRSLALRLSPLVSAARFSLVAPYGRSVLDMAYTPNIKHKKTHSWYKLSRDCVFLQLISQRSNSVGRYHRQLNRHTLSQSRARRSSSVGR
eukprot:2385186-Rhodomonas_salina.2